MVEQRGCGKSAPEKSDSTTISVTLTIEDFEIIRKEIGIKKWTVLGFSYGGLLATVYTNTYPKSVSSLFLLNSVGINPKPVTYFFDNINSKLRPSYVEVVEYWSDSSRIAENRQHAIVEIIRARMPGYFYDRKKTLIVSQIIKDSDFNFAISSLIWNNIYSHKCLNEKISKFTKLLPFIWGGDDIKLFY